MDTNEKRLDPVAEEIARSHRAYFEVFAKITEAQAKAEAERWARDKERVHREMKRLAEEVKREREMI